MSLNRNDLCWCGSGKKYKKCHLSIDEKIAHYERKGCFVPRRDMLKTPAQIEGIRQSALLNNAILDEVAAKIKAGISTGEIDRIIHEKTLAFNAIPAPLGFEGFPKSTCTSINDEVCHGIPADDIILKDGDIVNVDVSTIYGGYYSDASRMFMIGNVSDQRRRLVEVTKECLELGTKAAKPWGFLGDIAAAIQEHAEKNGYSVVKELGGHGVGIEFHEEPFVCHIGQKGAGLLLVPGMVFTIEPMINTGKRDVYVDEANHWTVRTKDGGDSAQWEYTVLITEKGAEILAY